ncbi:peptidyl-tRNA hydrolase 2, mitochondrial isoform X1 [Cephus cinctus]|uniref:peptidyl-tRNA hydrolase n=1 Tax=Cephus cinctus TaxID=211228 RepID=A0AAJ7RLB1_CEPCN|nr:peptidyl-tRNA hydrolase 2, mitochondrial isoform X1 [Cephus cinctus]XP_024943044.1 peptidyl-tRNA hydrolase 2, mitochondrial isoform X1 [Cephus cinctus]
MGSIIKHIKSIFADSLHKDGYKMVIVVRTDIPMGKGKIAAQCAHAALECYRQASTDKKHEDLLYSWLRFGQPKIILKIPSEKELLTLAHNAQVAGLVTAVIKDAGRTQLEPGTISAIGIGPAPRVLVERLTSNLKLL